MTKEEIFKAIDEELTRAQNKFKKWPTDMIHASAILNEEAGEVTRAVLQYIYEPEKGMKRKDIEGELIQTAAMAVRMFLNLDHYVKNDTFEYSKCEKTHKEKTCKTCIEYVDNRHFHRCLSSNGNFNESFSICDYYIEAKRKDCKTCAEYIENDGYHRCNILSIDGFDGKCICDYYKEII